jgi:hypothetical protein
MKKLTLLLSLVAFVFYANAQTIPAPEFKNKVMVVDKNNTLSDLDKTDMTSSLKTSMMGHSEVNLVADGKTSKVTRTGKSDENYIVKLDADVDPSVAVELFKFDESKKARKIMVASMSLGKDNPVDLPKAEITFKKISAGVYLISTAKPLEGGEYCFMINRPNISVLGAANTQALIGYCFTVTGS